MRTVKEWIGKTDDSKPPPSVRARIFLTHKGICHISKRPIGPADKWECEHVKAIWEGGENRESNMRPALVEPHARKTAEEAGRRAKADRIRQKHLGIFPASKAKIKSRAFQKSRPEAPHDQ